MYVNNPLVAYPLSSGRVKLSFLPVAKALSYTNKKHNRKIHHSKFCTVHTLAVSFNKWL